MRERDTVVETIALTKRYGRHDAIRDVMLQIEEGAIYGLLGPNGAGKTTLLKLLVGLLRPTAGEVRLFGAPWRREFLWHVGALIETPALYGHVTGAENLAVHTRLLGIAPARIAEVLAQVDLHQVTAGKRVSAYSLGMKQRLGIACALLSHPRVLILDEPTNGLDPIGIRDMRALIHALSAQGITVIVSSHTLGEVAQVVTHVGVLSAGRLRYQGSLADLLARGKGRLALDAPADAHRVWSLLAREYPGVRLEGQRILVPAPESAVATLVAELAREGIGITHVSYQQDDLEAIFLRLVDQPDQSVVHAEVPA
ncbi:MAG: ATP-binding cassette domain-containing protein [Ktedonobacterales bacterium]|nr:ATP-binding cassette domain-containing protein [Ktedonobacterales bacterium]